MQATKIGQENNYTKRRQIKVQKFCIFATKNTRRDTKVGQNWSLSKSSSSFPKGCTMPKTLLRHSESEVVVQYPTRNIIAGNQKCRIKQWQKRLRLKYKFGHCTKVTIEAKIIQEIHHHEIQEKSLKTEKADNTVKYWESRRKKSHHIW